MAERKVNQRFSYTGSSDYEINNVILDDKSGVSYINTLTGVGGVGPIPYDGATVTVETGVIGSSSDVKDLQPGMDNKLYYLITDETFTEDDKDTVLSLATEIPVTVVSSRYQGTFVFKNPNECKNLYLIWDYTETLETVVSFSGQVDEKVIDVDFGSDIGRAGVRYGVSDTPARFVIKNGSTTVADSGYVGLNSLANYNALIAAGVDDADINLQTPYDGLVNNGTADLRS